MPVKQATVLGISALPLAQQAAPGDAFAFGAAVPQRVPQQLQQQGQMQRFFTEQVAISAQAPPAGPFLQQPQRAITEPTPFAAASAASAAYAAPPPSLSTARQGTLSTQGLGFKELMQQATFVPPFVEVAPQIALGVPPAIAAPQAYSVPVPATTATQIAYVNPQVPSLPQAASVTVPPQTTYASPQATKIATAELVPSWLDEAKAFVAAQTVPTVPQATYGGVASNWPYEGTFANVPQASYVNAPFLQAASGSLVVAAPGYQASQVKPFEGASAAYQAYQSAPSLATQTTLTGLQSPLTPALPSGANFQGYAAPLMQQSAAGLLWPGTALAGCSPYSGSFVSPSALGGTMTQAGLLMEGAAFNSVGRASTAPWSSRASPQPFNVGLQGAGMQGFSVAPALSTMQIGELGSAPTSAAAAYAALASNPYGAQMSPYVRRM